MSFVLLAVGLLPASRIKNVLLNLCGRGWSIARTARIHPTVMWQVGRLVIGERGYIGPGNVLRDLVLVDLADRADIGQFNWITGQARYADQSEPAAAGTLVMEDGAAIASRHYLDCAGGLRLGRMSILAGVRSTFLTHFADHREWVLRGAPIVVGAMTIVSSGVTVTAGSSIADRCVVAAGAVVPKDLDQPGKLYAGVPAKVVTDLSDAAHANRSDPRFFSREDARALVQYDRART